MIKNDPKYLNIGTKIKVNNYNLQQLTTKQIIRTVLNQDIPQSFINQQKQLKKPKHQQYRVLKSHKTITEQENMTKSKLNKMQSKTIENQFQNTCKNDSQLEKQDDNNLSQSCYEFSLDKIQINDKIQNIQKQVSQQHQQRFSQTQNVELSKKYELIDHEEKNFKSRQHFLTSSIEQEEIKMKKNQFDNQNSSLKNQMQLNNKNVDIQEIFKNQKTSLDIIENSSHIQLYQKKNLKQNQFTRKNSRIHMIRRSVADLFQSSVDDSQSKNIRKQKIKGELQHSLSQGDVVSGCKERKLYETNSQLQNNNSQRNSKTNISSKYNSNQQSIQNSLDNININSNDIALHNSIDKNYLNSHNRTNQNSLEKLRQHSHDKSIQDFNKKSSSKQFNKSNLQFQNKYDYQNNQSFQKQNFKSYRSKSNLQDLIEKKKQEKYNEVAQGFNNYLLQKQNKKEQSERYQQDQSLEQLYLDYLKLNMNDIPILRLKNNNSFITTLYPKTSRRQNKNNQNETNALSHRQERLSSIDNSSMQLVKQPWSIALVSLSQDENEKIDQIKQKDLQLQNNLHKLNQSQTKIRSFSQDIKLIQENQRQSMNQKENEMSNLKQQKFIQELIKSLNKKTLNQNKLEYKISIEKRKNTYTQSTTNNQQNQKISSNYQYQPVQSINLQKYNEFKLNKQRRAQSIQNKEFGDQSECKENIQIKDDKFIHNLVEEYDAQSISILKNNILIHSNKEDKGFDLNQFLKVQYNNLIKNPIINQSCKEDKIQQIRNIRNNYNFKHNQFSSQNKNSNLLFNSNDTSQRFNIQNEHQMNFSAWDNEVDMNQREELEDIKLLYDYSKKSALLK